MSTVTTLLAEVESRLNDATNVVWTETELKTYVRFAIKSLFPTYYRRRIEETTAGPGPLQAKPAGARHLYMLGLKRSTSTRVRPVRGWIEGEGNAFISKSGITGDTLVWGWIEGFNPPDDDDANLTIPLECEEVVVLSATITALEKLLTDRVSQDRYFSLNVRQAASEVDILDSIEGLKADRRDIEAKAIPRPGIRA